MATLQTRVPDNAVPDNTLTHTELLEQGLTALLELDLPTAETHFRDTLTLAAGSKDSLALARAYQGLGDVAAVRREHHEATYYFQKSRTQFLRAKAHRALGKLEQRLAQLAPEAAR